MRPTHTRRAAIAVLSLLKLDAFLKPGQVATLRFRRLLFAKSQLRRVEKLPQAARERLGLVIAFIGLQLLTLADILSKRPPMIPAGIEAPIGEPTPSLRLGLDEHDRVEVIDVSPAGLEDRPSAVPAQASRALLAPSTNRTTAATSKKRPQAADRDAQLEAAKRLLAGGQSIRAAARRLGVSESTLRGWRKKFSAEAAV